MDNYLDKCGRKEDGRRTVNEKVRRIGRLMEEGERVERKEVDREECWSRVGGRLFEGGRMIGGREKEDGRRDLGRGLIIYRKMIYGWNIEMLKSDGFRGRKLVHVGGLFKSEQNMGKIEKNVLSESHLVSNKENLKDFD